MCPERVRNRVLNGRSGRLFAGFMLPGQARLSQRDVSSERNGKKHFIKFVHSRKLGEPRANWQPG